MIPNDEKKSMMALSCSKTLSALLHRITSKNKGDFHWKLKSYQDAKVCYICGKRFIKKFANDKNYRKVAIIQVNVEVQHIVFVI